MLKIFRKKSSTPTETVTYRDGTVVSLDADIANSRALDTANKVFKEYFGKPHYYRYPTLKLTKECRL
jgi:hypothetical protein